MVLWITDRDIDCGITDYKIDFHDFASKECHPFIATTKWSKVNIDVTDETPRGIIRQLVPLASINPIYDIESDISAKQIQILCEVYPDDAPKIRAYHMKGDTESLKELLSNLKEVACSV